MGKKGAILLEDLEQESLLHIWKRKGKRFD